MRSGSFFGGSRRGALVGGRWVAVVAFESSSLSSLGQSLTGHPNAPVRISLLSRGATCLQDQDVELNLPMLQVLCSRQVHHQGRLLMGLIVELERKTATEASESQNKIFYCGIMQFYYTTSVSQ